MTLGERIRRVRTLRSRTLEKLAQRTGLTSSFLSQVERDVVSPSVESLQKIARALETRVGSFFEEEENRELTLIRKAERRRQVHENTHTAIETLASGLLNVSMEPQLFTLDVGGEVSEERNGHVSEAFGLVLQGSVELMRGKVQRLSLANGDSIYLRNPRPYKIVNPGSQRAEVLWITFTAGILR